MVEEDYEDGNEELVDMSGYDLDSPVEYDHSIKPFVPAESQVRRTCYNDECTWEDMLGEDQRTCPACEAQVRGWKPKSEV